MKYAIDDRKIPISIRPFTSRLVAYEAFCRGLQLEFVRDSKSPEKFKIYASDGDDRHLITTESSLTTSSAARVCLRKDETKKYLISAGVDVPKGRVLNSLPSKEKLVELVDKYDFPLVIKPAMGIKGAGVITEISSIEDLGEALKKQNFRKGGVIVEEQVEGDEYRVLVVGGSYVAAVKRIAPEVLGDGELRVKDLVKSYNERRLGNNHLRIRLVKINDDLKQVLRDQELTLDSVPSMGRRVLLSYAANFSAGGRSIDCTDELDERIREVCVSSVKAIPGLAYAGVDVIITKKGRAVVLEINHDPAIGSHHFPDIGKPRDAAASIVDQYFPNSTRRKHHVYFGFNKIKKYFDSKFCNRLFLRIPESELDSMVSMKIVYNGVLKKAELMKFIREYADSKGVHGRVKILSDGMVELLISGSRDIVEKIINISEKGNDNIGSIGSVNKETSSIVVFEGFKIS